MADHAPFYYRTNSASSVTDIDLDPPRTRIAVACNRCRRRKIKCSGSLEGASCEGCIRANQAECVFADRPAPLKTPTSAGFDVSMSASSPIQLQPSASSRTSSLPGHQFSAAPMRSSPNISRLSMDDLKPHSPTRTSATASPTFPMPSPSSANKRTSITSAHHPYQRPSSSASIRRPSGDPVSTNLARYSQSLIQAQAMQLSGRQPQMLVPQSSRASLSSRASSYAQSAGGFQLQPALVASPNYRFRQPDYPGIMQVNRSGATPDLAGNVYTTPDSLCYSPVFPSGLYSAQTPDLVSSDSVSTLDSRSTFSTNSDMSYLKHQQLAVQPYIEQPNYINVEYGMQNTMPVNDPNQWTPGVDKIANQWLQFSPQQSEQFF